MCCEDEGYNQYVLDNLMKSRDALNEMIRLSKRGSVNAKVFYGSIGHIGGWLQEAAGYLKPWVDDG